MKPFFNITIILFFAFQTGIGQNQVFIPYRDGRLWGYADTLGNIVLSPEYIDAISEKNGFFFVESTNGKGLVNSQNEIIIPFSDNNIIWFEEDFFVFSPGGKYRILYSYETGERIFPGNITNAVKLEIFKGNYYHVYTKTGKQGIAKLSDKHTTLEEWAIDTSYIEIAESPTSINCLIVKNDKVESRFSPYYTQEQIDSLDNVRYEVPDMTMFSDFFNEENPEDSFDNWSEYSLSKIERKNGYSLIIEKKWMNEYGEEEWIRDTLKKVYTNIIIIPKYRIDSTKLDIHNSVALITNRRKKQGVVDGCGNILIPLKYDSISTDVSPISSPFYFTVKKKNKWGIINSMNEIVLPCDYDWIYHLGSYQLFGMQKNGLFGAYKPLTKTINLEGVTKVYPAIMFEVKCQYPITKIRPISNYVVAVVDYKGKFYGYYDYKGFSYFVN